MGMDGRSGELSLSLTILVFIGSIAAFGLREG
jgi:hypothetical protein